MDGNKAGHEREDIVAEAIKLLLKDAEENNKDEVRMTIGAATEMLSMIISQGVKINALEIQNKLLTQTINGLLEKERNPDVVFCKDCKHRPLKPDDYESGFDLEFPDNICPCQCEDGYYSWYPADHSFCSEGDPKE